MKEIPILFSPPMVAALLDKRKTQTRRLVKWPKVPEWHDWDYAPDTVERRADEPWWPVFNHKGFNKDISGPVRCPYGQPGDLLYVRESWFPAAINNNEVLIGYDVNNPDDTHSIVTDKVDYYWKQLEKGRVIPSIHMPKEAARIWLQVESIRVERLQDISEEDAVAEGVQPNCEGVEKCPSQYCQRMGCQSTGEYYHYLRDLDDFPAFSAKESFESLWQSINGDESWNDNPWVWCVSFRVLSTTGKPSLVTEKQNHE